MDDVLFPPLADCHAHVRSVKEAKDFPQLMDQINAQYVGLACQSDASTTNTNPSAFVLKAQYPERFFLLAGLDHSAKLYGFEETPSLEWQIHTLREIGMDGIKILASKPTLRKRLGQPLDGPYFSDFFAACENYDIPILWHVADPDEFWNPVQLPEWAKERNWGYDGTFPAKNESYQEVEKVLVRYPSLRIVFPHFYFLSSDLERTEKLLCNFPNVNLDLAPGIELYYNLSRIWEKAAEFFRRYSDRILFGTDIWSGLSSAQARARAGVVFRFLTEKTIFRVPKESDDLLGDPEAGLIHGLSLPAEVQQKILMENFQRIFGNKPIKLDVSAARQECLRLAKVEAKIQSCPEEETEGFLAAEVLAQV